jgi:hypothetical protein
MGLVVFPDPVQCPCPRAISGEKKVRQNAADTAAAVAVRCALCAVRCALCAVRCALCAVENSS